MTDTLLQTQALTKSYGSAYQLGPVELNLRAGQTVALLGQNGAGKTTFFQLITGSLDASGGEIHFMGHRMLPEAYQLKRSVGYLPQNLYLPRWVTGAEMLSYAVSLYELPGGKQLIRQAAKYWDCESYLHKPLATCSHGMLKRVALALATLHEPPFLILDEPFSGLDLFHIRALEQKIIERNETGKTTILSTHSAHNAAKLCQRALVLERGQMRELTGWEHMPLLERVSLIEKTFFAPAAGASH